MKKYTILFISAIILSIFIITACKKVTPVEVNADVTIYYTGEPASDGCGWLVKPDNENTTFKPVNLDDAYKINNAKATISYIILNTKYTGCIQVPNSPGIDQIEIKSIILK